MKTIKKIVIGIILFVLPTKLARILLYPFRSIIISSTARIGFSFIMADSIELHEESRIGLFNYINCVSLRIGKGGVIRHFNVLKGIFHLKMDEASKINRNTIIVNSLNIPELRLAYTIPSLAIGYNSVIGVNHFLDMTGSITIGANSILAGRSSELWTHGFYHALKGEGRWMIRGNISIGDNCYIGSHVIFNLGCSVCDGVTIGAGSIVSKNISKRGAYVPQPLRYLEFDPEIAIQRYRTSDGYHFEKG